MGLGGFSFLFFFFKKKRKARIVVVVVVAVVVVVVVSTNTDFVSLALDQVVAFVTACGQFVRSGILFLVVVSRHRWFVCLFVLLVTSI